MTNRIATKGGPAIAVIAALFALVYLGASSIMSCTPPLKPGPAFTTSTVWTYKILFIEAPAKARTGTDALSSSLLPLEEPQLNALGKDGWELVSSFVEEETAFPNLGDTKYVTGLQPNIRPRRAVLVFKHASMSP